MQSRHVLITVLDWGLGHATRCIPIIDALVQRQHNVFLASSGNALKVLRQKFPQLDCFELPGYQPQYDSYGRMVWSMASQLPKFIRTIQQEKEETEKLITSLKIDCVISDNRYGCYSRRVKSIFITHQVHLLMPWKIMEPAVNFVNFKLLQNYDECWIPAGNDTLIPALLQGKDEFKYRYIGYLSHLDRKPKQDKKYKILALSSGPEPQRTIFYNMLSGSLSKTGLQAMIAGGMPEDTSAQPYTINNLTSISYLGSEALSNAIAESELIIARSGYSTVMDLMKLNARAVFIPTPGQTEQEYIAAQLLKTGMAFSMPQKDFDLTRAIKASENYGVLNGFGQSDWLLQKAIDSLS